MCARFSGWCGLCSCNRRELAHFAARSLQQKIPFLTYFQRPVRSLRGEQAVWSRSSPPPSLRKPALFSRQAIKPPFRPFLAISSSHFSVSVKSIRSPGRFRPAGLRPQKSRSRRGRARRRAILALRWCSSFRGCECRGTISTTQSFRTGQFPIGFRSLCAGISAIRSGSFWSLQTRLSLVAILAALSPHLTRLAFRNCEQ